LRIAFAELAASFDEFLQTNGIPGSPARCQQRI
jgi:hypothetical protein